ncbi:MAG: hypothetical protein AAGF46_05760, partial [Pseudomonadota bacterium]
GAFSAPVPLSQGWYRSSMWLNKGHLFPGESYWSQRAGRKQHAPGLPDDTVSFSGYELQAVHIIPSTGTVIVRQGLTRGRDNGRAVREFIAKAYGLALQETTGQ